MKLQWIHYHTTESQNVSNFTFTHHWQDTFKGHMDFLATEGTNTASGCLGQRSEVIRMLHTILRHPRNSSASASHPDKSI